MNNGDKVCFWRDPDIKSLEIRFSRYDTFAFPNHSHDTYSIGVAEEGGAYCLGIGNDKAFVSAGETALIHPGQIHSGIPVKDVGITYRMFYADKRWMREAALDIFQQEEVLPEFTKTVVKAPLASRLLLRLNRLVAHGGSLLEKESVMLSAFGLLLSSHGRLAPCSPGAGQEHQAVQRVKDYIGDNLGRKVSLKDLSKATNLSRYHLLRVFKKAVGLPPHAFQTQMRIDKARSLLLMGTPPAQVAAETGFTDQSHFSNKFKQYLGATPGQYSEPRLSNNLQYAKREST